MEELDELEFFQTAVNTVRNYSEFLSGGDMMNPPDWGDMEDMYSELATEEEQRRKVQRLDSYWKKYEGRDWESEREKNRLKLQEWRSFRWWKTIRKDKIDHWSMHIDFEKPGIKRFIDSLVPGSLQEMRFWVKFDHLYQQMRWEGFKPDYESVHVHAVQDKLASIRGKKMPLSIERQLGRRPARLTSDERLTRAMIAHRERMKQQREEAYQAQRKKWKRKTHSYLKHKAYQTGFRHSVEHLWERQYYDRVKLHGFFEKRYDKKKWFLIHKTDEKKVLKHMDSGAIIAIPANFPCNLHDWKYRKRDPLNPEICHNSISDRYFIRKRRHERERSRNGF